MTTLRGNGRPSGKRYDDGCDVHDRCVTCPFEQCKWDDPVAFNRARRRERDASIVAYRREHPDLRVGAMADHFGITRRQFERIWANRNG